MKRKARVPDHWDMITERAFTAQVIRLAQHLGWRTAHFRPGKTQRGRWVTAVQGDGAGFPDLVLVHPTKCRLIFAELKREYGGVISDKQNKWLDALTAVRDMAKGCNCVEVFLWQPSDIDDIESVLK